MYSVLKLLAACLVFTLVGAFQVIAQSFEQFDYAPAASLAGLNGGTGWNGAWRSQTAGMGAIEYQPSSPGLESLNLLGEAGNAAFSAGGGTRVVRDFDQTYDSGTVFLSFLMQHSNNTVNPFSALELNLGGDDDDDRVFSLGLLFGDDGDPFGDARDLDFAARVQQVNPSGAGVTQGVAFLNTFDTEVNLYVGRFDLDSDTLDLFVNPDGGTNLVGAGDESIALTSNFAFDRVRLANFIDVNAVAFDEIRVSATAPSLTSLDGPAVPGDVDGLGTVDLTDFEIIRDNFQTTVSSFMEGDISGPTGARDLKVDLYDFIAWATAFEAAGGSTAGLSLSTTAVPEPASATLALIAGCGFLRRRL